MKRNPIETVLGVVVLIVAVMFLALVYTTANIRAVKGYQVTADFLKVGGLTRGSDVRMSGIAIGTVTDQHLDPKTFTANVVMTIQGDVQLPSDTEASIVGDGLLGSKYVDLVPGQASDRIPPGGKITHARDFQSLEDLVGQIIFMATQDPNKPADAAPADQVKPVPAALPKDAPK